MTKNKALQQAQKESHGAMKEDKRPGYGNKKIEGPNRPSV